MVVQNNKVIFESFRKELADEINLIEKQIAMVNLDYFSLLIGIISSIILVIGIGFQDKLIQLWVPGLFVVDALWGIWGVLHLIANAKKTPVNKFLQQYKKTDPTLLNSRFSSFTHLLSSFNKANSVTHLASIIIFFHIINQKDGFLLQNAVVIGIIFGLILIYLVNQTQPKIFQSLNESGFFQKSSDSYDKIKNNWLYNTLVGVVIISIFLIIALIAIALPTSGLYLTYLLGLFEITDIYFLVFVFLAQVIIISVLACYFSAINAKIELNNWLSTNTALIFDCNKLFDKNDLTKITAIKQLHTNSPKYLVKLEYFGFLLFFTLIEIKVGNGLPSEKTV